MRRVLAFAAALVVWVMPGSASAQPASTTAPGRIEVAAGVTWTGAFQLSGRDATEIDRNGNPYRLFAADSELRSVIGFATRVAVPLGGRLLLEGGLAYGAPELTVRVSADTEGAAGMTVSEALGQLQVEAGIVATLRRWRPAQRSVPFVTAGAGYFRELHQGRTLAADGRSYFAGGGLKHILRARRDSWLKGAGLRFDARLAVRRKGASFDDRARYAPAVAGSLFMRF